MSHKTFCNDIATGFDPVTQKLFPEGHYCLKPRIPALFNRVFLDKPTADDIAFLTDLGNGIDPDTQKMIGPKHYFAALELRRVVRQIAVTLVAVASKPSVQQSQKTIAGPAIAAAPTAPAAPVAQAAPVTKVKRRTRAEIDADKAVVEAEEERTKKLAAEIMARCDAEIQRKIPSEDARSKMSKSVQARYDSLIRTLQDTAKAAAKIGYDLSSVPMAEIDALTKSYTRRQNRIIIEHHNAGEPSMLSAWMIGRTHGAVDGRLTQFCLKTRDSNTKVGVEEMECFLDIIDKAHEDFPNAPYDELRKRCQKHHDDVKAAAEATAVVEAGAEVIALSNNVAPEAFVQKAA